MAKTYTLTMANSWTAGTFTVSHTTAGKVTVTVKLTRPDGGTSYNYNASKNFYITIAGSTYYHTVEKVSGTSGTSFSSSKTVSLSDAGAASVSVKVGGSLSGTTFKITGNNSKTYSITDGTKATYTIKYNANGGTGAPSSQTKTYGTTLTLSSTKPTRASETDADTTISYTFKGWAISASASSAAYSAGGKYTDNKSVTLYAVWAASTTINQHIIEYITDNEQTIEPQAKPVGSTVTITTTVPEKHGYTFNKWNTASDGSGTTYTAGQSYSTNADLTLFAIYNPWTHTVKFNANGGSGAPSSFTKTTDVDVFIPATEPTRSGYTFKCWNTASDGSGTIYEPNELYTHTQNSGTVTLYAIWVSTDIFLYKNKSCKAIEFDETSDFTGFAKGGIVMSGEFVEGNVMNFKSNQMYFAEIIEK